MCGFIERKVSSGAASTASRQPLAHGGGASSSVPRTPAGFLGQQRVQEPAALLARIAKVLRNWECFDAMPLFPSPPRDIAILCIH